GDNLALVDRHERPAAARVGAVTETEPLREPVGMAIHLPARGAMDSRLLAEDFLEALAGKIHLPACPLRIGLGDLVLPQHVIPGMDAGFKAHIPGVAHDTGALASDIRRRQQGAVQQGFDPIVAQYGSPAHLAQEAGSKYTGDRAAGVIGAEGE